MIRGMASALGDLVAGALREVKLELAAAENRRIELTAAERWARDPIGWINGNVWIASKFAGKRGRIAPMRMRLFPDQEATIAAWIDLPHLEATGELVFHNIVIEKSRQIGETWLFAAVVLWALHYHAVTGLAIHQKGAEIANRGPTIKSLFGRVVWMDKRLDRNRVPGLGRLHFKPFAGGDPASIENLDNGATVYGEARRDDPGRGGSFDFILADEAAFILHGEAVFAAIDEACPNGKALLSTPNGSDNFHARIADDEPEGWQYLRLHWSTHPVYSTGLHIAAVAPAPGRPGRMAKQPTEAMAIAATACELCKGTIRGLRWNAQNALAHRFPGRLTSPWYDQAVRAKTAEQVASELDIDRERSLTARVYDEFDSTVHVVPEIPFEVDLPLELAFDYGLDCTSVVICQDAPSEYRIIGEVELVDRPGETPTPENVVQRLVATLAELGVERRFLTPEWTRRIFARGDPSGVTGRELSTGRPLTSSYRALGFEIGRPPSYLTRTVEPSIRSFKLLLLGTPKPVRISRARCPLFIRHVRHNRWPTDSQGKRQINASRPLDDEHNHMMRSIAYLTVSKFPPITKRRELSGSITDEDEGSRWGSLIDDLEVLPYDSSG